MSVHLGRALLLGPHPHLRAAAAHRGLRPITCATGTDPALPGETLVEVADHANADELLGALARAGVPLTDIGCVLSAKETGVVAAALLGAALGVAALPVDTAVACRDKVVQKQRVRAAGIPTATVRAVAGLAEFAHLDLPGFTGGVLKPTSGVACQATRLVTGAPAVRETAAALLADGVTGQFVLEDLVSFDEEWFVDGVVGDGVLRFASVGRYVAPPLAVTGGGLPQKYVFDPDAHADRYALALATTRPALAALGLRDGVFHMELFHSAGTVSFGECAARPGGGAAIELVANKFGVDLVGLAVDAVLGAPTAPPPTPQPGIFGKTALPVVPGYVESAPGVDELLALPGAVAAHTATLPGATMPDLRQANRDHGGWLILRADDEPTLRARMAHAVDWTARATTTRTAAGQVRTLLDAGADLGLAFAGGAGRG
ncbi:hypothetical protein [Actinokineospora diospyrosa]|uniref:Phosphoribosylaminoimidazole carboxylase (NCAIR synthetase) n=1 Tax=Actinokineospora diospyrosa TaxID=103728 RepID=A0ABT1I9Q0_9PSEU|nr:hypothetical protein [Actinokineospora diospyrosa]MCP2269360.1 Phosphoribosylaminoimidazole carboxylase (NCAIR synthetase) [Actinokineospora diospyrosa]